MDKGIRNGVLQREECRGRTDMTGEVEQIQDILIKCALDNDFDIGIEAIDTYELPEDVANWIREKE